MLCPCCVCARVWWWWWGGFCPERDWKEDPNAAVNAVRATLPEEVERRQRIMARYAAPLEWGRSANSDAGLRHVIDELVRQRRGTPPPIPQTVRNETWNEGTCWLQDGKHEGRGDKRRRAGFWNCVLKP